MTVTETVIALIRAKPDLDLVAGVPAGVIAAAQAAVDVRKGIGTFTSYATEVGLPVKGTWKNPAVGSAHADVVVTAPHDGVPLLFIEVDNCTEEPPFIAATFDKHVRFFLRKGRGTDGIEIRSASAPPSARWGRVLVWPVCTGRADGMVWAVFTPSVGASFSWRAGWGCCANTVWPGPPSGALVAIAVSRSSS